jgi:hypothetical protein
MTVTGVAISRLGLATRLPVTTIDSPPTFAGAGGGGGGGAGGGGDSGGGGGATARSSGAFFAQLAITTHSIAVAINRFVRITKSPRKSTVRKITPEP